MRTAASFSGSGREGSTTARMIPAMSGLARPELLATTEWLAENLGRSGDPGPGPPLAAGRQRAPGPRHRPHPRAPSLVDWRTRAGRGRRGRRHDPARRPGPDGGARGADRASPTGPRSWSTTTPRACSPRAPGGACGPTASTRSGSSTAATRTGSPRVARSRTRRRGPAPATTGFTVRGPNRIRLTTADVRGLLGSPDVTLLDARAPAEYHGFEGNTKRLGHIPGAVNVPGRGHQRARPPAPARRRRPCATCSIARTWCAAAGWSATTGRGSRRPSSRSC